MDQFTLVANEILYLAFYLKEKDPTTGSITPYDLSSANSIVFALREYNSTINILTLTMSTVSSPSCTLGYCRVLATIPAANNYYSQIHVYTSTATLTWDGPQYIVEERI